MKIKFLLAILFIFLSFSSALSQQEEITGLIFDQTKTKMGRDFYEEFTKYWEPPPGMNIFNITIEEIADPKFGSKIIVRIDDIILYQSFLKPRLEDIENKAKEAVNAVTEFIINWPKYKKYLESKRKIL